DFDGSVVIKGDISAGMTVHVSGDIEIGGVVETATLEAGGSIVVKGGVIGGLGRKTTEEHHIRCAGCFNAAYAQQARIEAGDSIFIDDMAMQCELTAVNHIQVGNKRRGHIIGGHVQATFSITAKVFGSPNRVRTHCTIGVNPLMHKQMLELSKTRDGQETQLLEISKLLDFSRKNPGKLRPEMIEKAQATAVALSSGIAALREEEEALAKKIALSQQSRVNVQQAIHEGVEIHMGKQCYRVTGEHGPCSVGLGEAGLELLPLEVAK
ncbi:MAG: FapA family protein, partial [Rhodocyclaceae bacterium]|nr:FapA family protein [Rhodocyclaceae bacterium]